jgi:5-methylthioadenosine/S-adenosylhomocysteine deaminase
MTLLRGYGEGLPLDRWLTERVYPFEGRLTAEDVYWGTLVGVAEMLRSGVTSFTDMYDFCDSICRSVELSGIKANISRGLVSLDGSPLRDSPGFYEAADVIDKWHGAAGGRIVADASIHAEYTSHEGFVRDLADFAKSRGVGVHIHLSETEAEHRDCIARHGVTPAGYFQKMGILNSRTLAAHCVFATERDIAILHEHGATAAHCPSSNLKLGSGIAPVPKMLAAGLNVAIGTDGASSNNNLNMLEELHLTGLIHKGFSRDAALLPPAELLRMATVNGARAQGRGDTGAIRAGYKADLAVLDLDRPHLVPAHDILSNVVFAAQGSDVVMTVVDGKILSRDGEFLTFDVRGAMERARAAARRIAEEL